MLLLRWYYCYLRNSISGTTLKRRTVLKSRYRYFWSIAGCDTISGRCCIDSSVLINGPFGPGRTLLTDLRTNVRAAHWRSRAREEIGEIKTLIVKQRTATTITPSLLHHEVPNTLNTFDAGTLGRVSVQGATLGTAKLRQSWWIGRGVRLVCSLIEICYRVELQIACARRSVQLEIETIKDRYKGSLFALRANDRHVASVLCILQIHHPSREEMRFHCMSIACWMIRLWVALPSTKRLLMCFSSIRWRIHIYYNFYNNTNDCWMFW